MAQRRRKNRSWFKSLLIFVLTPLIIWFLAFLTWFYWNDIIKLSGWDKDRSRTPSKAARNLDKPDRPESPAEKRAQEKILEEDRKKLDAILKERR